MTAGRTGHGREEEADGRPALTRADGCLASSSPRSRARYAGCTDGGGEENEDEGKEWREAE